MLDRTRKPSALPERFDGAAAWDKLTKKQQREIGSIAIELAVAARGWATPIKDSAVGRAIYAANELLCGQLDKAMIPAIGEFARDTALRLPSRLGDVCRACGCTEHDACHPKCCWVEPGLCSKCAVKP
jgi:hypothetical protein